MPQFVAFFLALCAAFSSSSAVRSSDYVDDNVDFLPIHVTQYAGYIPVNTSNLFYWFFEAQAATDTTPVMIWLNGGPGASSLFGCFSELGPVKLNASGLPEPNPNSWNQNMHLLFWDQPVGTGFSYTTDPNGYMTNEEDLSFQFYMALQGFYGRHPEYLQQPLYIAGESYAGKYIPYIATQILKKNELNAQQSPALPLIRLEGMSIGNGWMDPVIQHRVAIDFGFAMGLIDIKQKQHVEDMYAKCATLLQAEKYEEADSVCGSGGGGNGQDGIMGYILNSGGNPDIYDVREFADGINAKLLGEYLNSDFVRSKLRVGDHKWNVADGTNIVAQRLITDLQKPNTLLLTPLLQVLPQVLFYTGVFDMSCGYMGTEEILFNLNWQGQAEWQQLDRIVWKDPTTNTTAGMVKQLRGVTQVAVSRAGHLVPTDRPQISKMMIENFVFKKPWVPK